jgi:predicted secreted protein
MERSKKIVLLCHCLLNTNSKVEGLSTYSGANVQLITRLMEHGYGIIQLPCPEMSLYGIQRWGHVKEQFNTPYFRKNCRKILGPIVDELLDYQKNGYLLCGVIGVDGSPSCGVNLTCSSSIWGGEIGNEYNLEAKIKDLKMKNDEGVFIEELKIMLKEQNLTIPFVAICEEDGSGDFIKIINNLGGKI